jgi:hypothetical protein
MRDTDGQIQGRKSKRYQLRAGDRCPSDDSDPELPVRPIPPTKDLAGMVEDTGMPEPEDNLLHFTEAHDLLGSEVWLGGGRRGGRTSGVRRFPDLATSVVTPAPYAILRKTMNSASMFSEFRDNDVFKILD